MTAQGSTSYNYGRNGNLTTVNNATSNDDSLTYNAANKWTSGTVNGQSVTFSYDGFGRRTSKAVCGRALITATG
jgi:YD repeat-containing protein